MYLQTLIYGYKNPKLPKRLHTPSINHFKLSLHDPAQLPPRSTDRSPASLNFSAFDYPNLLLLSRLHLSPQGVHLPQTHLPQTHIVLINNIDPYPSTQPSALSSGVSLYPPDTPTITSSLFFNPHSACPSRRAHE